MVVVLSALSALSLCSDNNLVPLDKGGRNQLADFRGINRYAVNAALEDLSLRLIRKRISHLPLSREARAVRSSEIFHFTFSIFHLIYNTAGLGLPADRVFAIPGIGMIQLKIES